MSKPETITVTAGRLNSGDKLWIGTQPVRITYVALVRGLEIEIKYRYTDLSMRGAGEKRMVVKKTALLEKIV